MELAIDLLVEGQRSYLVVKLGQSGSLF